jgi:hypothetical protein
LTTHRIALRIGWPPREGQVFRMEGPKVVIGSGPQCQLRLPAPGVSPVHCLLMRGPAGLFARSLVADTRLNGEPFETTRLNAGDCLSVGSVELQVLDADSPDEEPQAGSGPEQQAWSPTAPAAYSTADREIRRRHHRRVRRVLRRLRNIDQYQQQLQSQLEAVKEREDQLLDQLEQALRHLQEVRLGADEVIDWPESLSDQFPQRSSATDDATPQCPGYEPSMNSPASPMDSLPATAWGNPSVHADPLASPTESATVPDGAGLAETEALRTVPVDGPSGPEREATRPRAVSSTDSYVPEVEPPPFEAERTVSTAEEPTSTAVPPSLCDQAGDQLCSAFEQWEREQQEAKDWEVGADVAPACDSPQMDPAAEAEVWTEEDKTIEAYMTRLMQRIGGGWTPPSAQARQTEPSPEADSVADRKRAGTAAFEGSSGDSQADSAEARRETQLRRVRPADAGGRLDEFRAVANQTAHTAIHRYSSRRRNQMATTRTFISIVSVMVGGTLASWAERWDSVPALLAVISFLVAGICLISSVLLYLFRPRVRFASKADPMDPSSTESSDPTLLHTDSENPETTCAPEQGLGSDGHSIDTPNDSAAALESPRDELDAQAAEAEAVAEWPWSGDNQEKQSSQEPPAHSTT